MQSQTTSAQLETLPPPEGPKAVRVPVAIPALLSWLTVERGAYVGLALLALALRLAGLGTHPLSDAEAGQAMVAWHVYQGQPAEQVGYSPLIATLNLIGFALLGGNEFAARLGPALLGVALVVLPYGLRRHLGRTGALAASALFTISPTAIYLSRTVNGDIGAAVGGLALVVGLFGWLDALPKSPVSSPQSPAPSPPWPTRQGRQFPLAYPPGQAIPKLYLAAAGLVLLLTASSSAYSVLALLLGFLALAAAVGDKGYAAPARQGLAALRTRLVGWSDFGLALAIGLLAVATGLLFNLGGLAATADLLTSWLLGFAPAMAAQGAYPALFLFPLYEPLILLTGLFGLSAGLLRRRLIDLFLSWWFFGGIALDLLRSGRTAGEVLVPLVPLTLLGGLALGMLWDSLREEGSWQKEGITAVTGLVIGGYAYITLMDYTRTGGLTFWLPLAALGLYAGLVALFWVWYDGRSALRGASLAAVTLLLTFTVATGWRLNYSRLADPRQPLIRAPAGEGIPDMMTTLKRISSWRAGDPYLIEIIADRRLGPAVEWQLRRFDNVTWADTLNPLPPSSEQPTVVLAPANEPLSLDEGYVGQDFAVRAAWSPAGLRGQSLIRWIILRTADTPVSFERGVLWVEQKTETGD